MKKRGIQKGTSATSEESSQLDFSVKRMAAIISKAQRQYYFEKGHTCYKKGNKNHKMLPELLKRNYNKGLVPDGGMWFSGDRTDTSRTCLFVFEAKKQDDKGNAISRWSDNHETCRKVWPDVVYVTFCVGEGAKEGGKLHHFGENKKRLFNDEKEVLVYHYSEKGFTDKEIFDKMVEALKLDLVYEDVMQNLSNVRM